MPARSLEQVRWGIIGCGDVAEKKSGPALYQTPGSSLVAVMRRNVLLAEEFAHKHGAKRWYGSAEELVNDPEVNAVYIASPHNLHLEHVRLVASAGKAILCEKPVGVTLSEAEQILATATTAGVDLSVAYYRRFWPVVQGMRRLLAEGAIGEVLQARVTLSDYFAGDPKRAWFVSQSASGGGALANGGSHWVDLVRYLLGEVTEVSAQMSHRAGFEVEDAAFLLLRLSSGVSVNLTSSWNSHLPLNEFAILGTEGRMVAAPLTEGTVTVQRSGGANQVYDFRRQGVMHRELIEALVPALREGKSSPVGGAEAVAAWRIMDAAYRSAEIGKVVPIG